MVDFQIPLQMITETDKETIFIVVRLKAKLAFILQMKASRNMQYKISQNEFLLTILVCLMQITSEIFYSVHTSNLVF